MRVAVLKCHDELNALYNIDGKNVDQDELLCIRISKILKKPVESFVVSNDDFPEGKFDAYVISGSNKNPDRESIANTPWMRELLSFIRIHHENKVPMLGICFGHQMMAVAFGAKAYKLPEYEIGFRKLIIEESAKKDPIFHGINNEFYGIFIHHWAIYRSSLPFGARLLALSPDIPDQAVAFAVGDKTYGVQFHPERLSQDVKAMFEQREKFIKKDRRFNYTESSDANIKVLENFFKRIVNK